MAVKTLTAAISTHIQKENPNFTFVPGTYFATGYFPAPQTNRGFLIFDITSLNSDWTVNSATLNITVNGNFLGTSHTLNVYQVRQKWISGNEGTWRSDVSWNEYRNGQALAWETAGASGATDRDAVAIGSTTITSTTSGTVSITLSAAAIQDWIDGTINNDGLILVASNETDTTLVRWQSISNATPAYRPRLIIDYTPTVKTLLDDLTAYWKLDDNTYVDSSGNGYTLTPNAAPTQVAGVIGNATHFVETDSQWLSNSSAALKPGDTDWTFACWAKLTDNLDYRTIAGNRGADGQGWKMFYHKVTVLDYFVLQINDDGSTHGGGDQVICDTISFNGGNPPVDTWIFIACRHDSVRNYGQLFINNNAPDSSGAHWGGVDSGPYYPGAPLASTGNFTLARVDEATVFHHGDIDEVGFWNRCLSNDEILELYNSGAGLTYPFGLSVRITNPLTGKLGIPLRGRL